MKISVTGASGFIGRHVLTELLEHEVEVVAVTRDASRLAGLNKPSTLWKWILLVPRQTALSKWIVLMS